jgi:hypothetical protein
LFADVFGDRRRLDPSPDLVPGPLDGGGVRGVQAVQPDADPAGEAGVIQMRSVSVGDHDEAGRDG